MKWTQLDDLGNYVADVPPEYLESDEPPPFPDWTQDHPGDMPGPGATYTGTRSETGEWTGGTWEYAPPLPEDPPKEPTLPELQAQLTDLQAKIEAAIAAQQPTE